MDELGEMLTQMGRRVADAGCDSVPNLGCLAKAAIPFAPVAAAVLGSAAEPEVARSRAFMHVTLAAERLTPAERQVVVEALTAPVEQTVEARQPVSNTVAAEGSTLAAFLANPDLAASVGR